MYTNPQLIGLGANLPSPAGEPRETLAAALAALEARTAIRVVACSGWFHSPAFPPGSGPDFVNAAAVLATPLDPDALLTVMHEVERALGRDRRHRWVPRACDLDLLACGDLVLPDVATVAGWMALDPPIQAAKAPDELILPHPRLHERAFVLRPLVEVAPTWVHPILGLSVRDMLASLPAAALDEVAALDG